MLKISADMAITFFRTGKSKGETSAPGDPLQEKERFFQRLKNMEHQAISQLAKSVGSFLSTAPIRDAVSVEDREEIVNDAVFITLKKIVEGLFVPTEATPATYAIAVAKNLVRNRIQKKHLPTSPLDDFGHLPDIGLDPEKLLQNKEREKLLGQLLDQLGDPCRHIILLRYFEEVPDQEAVNRQLAPFSSTDSLKNKRSKCLKILADLVRRHKTEFYILS